MQTSQKKNEKKKNGETQSNKNKEWVEKKHEIY